MDEESIQKSAEAEQYHLKALFILHELQANKKVYGSNSALTGASPANVDLALQYINRCLEHFPEDAIYLNLKALLLWEGKGDKVQASSLLEKAAAIKPTDIDIQNNLKAIKSGQCFIATAAYGHPLADEIHALRSWRDNTLRRSLMGRYLVALYYRVSPPVASLVKRSPKARAACRWVISKILLIIQEPSDSGATQ